MMGAYGVETLPYIQSPEYRVRDRYRRQTDDRRTGAEA